MKIDKAEFGSITVAGETKRLYGTSHTISGDEARFVFEKGCEQLILGTGQYGNAALSPEAAAFCEEEEMQGHRQADPEGDQDLQSHAQAQGRAVPRDLLRLPRRRPLICA
jgi:hypothetical protein